MVDAIDISQKGWQATLEYSSPHVTKYSYSGSGSDIHHTCIQPIMWPIQVKYMEDILLARYDTNYSCSCCSATKTYSFGRGSLEIGWTLKMHQYLRTISELCLRRHMQKVKYEMGPKMVRVSFEPLSVASRMSSDVKT